ncbi:acetyl/propionyl/methylcrotonyl-CoA carboxylase subunit alpha [Sneathiella chinensis]|nr:acetyl-CoA carboxylase biotin carboxylase subunit [Sneathiella chinensis]
MSDFSKILIANRGEIACRVIRTAEVMGYDTVAVFSEADSQAPHTKMATEAVAIGPAPVGESYLSAAKIIEAAKKSGADAVHPGYGFLSENAEFAQACADNNLVFIGPSPQAITLMGNKAEAKRRMIKAGVPCVPGYEGEDQSDARFIAAAAEIGFPVMVKAAAGGGGRGMRLVARPEELPQALIAARSEAENAFGSGELILEKAVIRPRHIEIQVFADTHGNVLHLGERDCSIQRRHQKVIEEAPSPAVSEELRQRMGAAAVAAAEAINYSGAGTVEFLLSETGEFYFLEMNTRLQVEHPVTECITGHDLVEWQLRVARGEHLPATQADVTLTGHAIEARLYAEDPAKNFLPMVGTLLKWGTPSRDGLRTDHGLEDGFEVTPHYDAMIAKVIAYGQTREDARRKLISSLKDTLDLGLVTNRRFLLDCLKHPVFQEGGATTAFIDTHLPQAGREVAKPDFSALSLAAALHFLQRRHEQGSATDGWDSSGALSSPVTLMVEEDSTTLLVKLAGADRFHIQQGDEALELTVLDRTDSAIRYEIDGLRRTAHFAFDGAALFLRDGEAQFCSADITLAPAGNEASGGDGRIMAPMNGRVVDIHVTVGQTVTRGQTVASLEAMKMEHEITSRVDGIVTAIGANRDQQVATRALLVEIEPN